jgi:hypothetical protein
MEKGIPDFYKAVISLWFRAPKQSVIAASDHYIDTGVEDFRMMQKVMPLISFGKPQQNKNYQLVYEDIAHGDPQDNVVVYTPVAWDQKEPYDVDPSGISLVCDNEKFKLAFTLQMAGKGSYSFLTWFATDMTFIPDYNQTPPEGSGIVGQWFKSTIADGTPGIQDAQPEFFYVESRQTFEPDVWHHVLLSFDVEGTIGLGLPLPSSSCQLWYAVDDVDYRGWENLRPYRTDGDGLEPNNIITRTIFDNSGYVPDPAGRDLFFNHYIPAPSGTYNPKETPVPSGDGPIGLPASARYVESIFKVEMAEFQMWTGLTLDTGEEDNRRAFVDKDGKPVSPFQKKEKDPDNNVIKPSGSIELMGRKPDIMLHGSGNWKAGKNTGSSGIDAEDKPIPEGQFTRTGVIKAYKPDPSLHGPQSPDADAKRGAVQLSRQNARL